MEQYVTGSTQPNSINVECLIYRLPFYHLKIIVNIVCHVVVKIQLYDVNSVFSHSIDYLLTHRIHCCTVKKKITVNTVKHGANFECYIKLVIT